MSRTHDRQAHDDRHFDRWSARYDRSLSQPLLFAPVHRAVVAALTPRLSASAVVLDIGCGTGRLLDRLGAARPGMTLIGVDRSAGMVGAARSRRPHLWIESGTAESLPHPDRSFDAVVTTLSFHHWADKAGALAEVFRVLRPGGLFALTDMSVDDLRGRPAALWGRARRHMADMPPLSERDRLIEGAGLRVIDRVSTLHRRWVTLSLAERPAA